MIGDLVRIIKARLTFNRGYLPNWSEEIFLVYDRKSFKEPHYYLRDYNGEDIKGGFYELTSVSSRSERISCGKGVTNKKTERKSITSREVERLELYFQFVG